MLPRTVSSGAPFNANLAYSKRNAVIGETKVYTEQFFFEGRKTLDLNQFNFASFTDNLQMCVHHLVVEVGLFNTKLFFYTSKN